eukprot:CAMPEP_0169288818 /NCGR_PEP_ID=MMETSP1016-20121227/60777_1 /TAXON_ID=342587 /ORGANISM="Karlodinium micrum, Strain CCMP2283" /LENGTH=209 /DNA_ID=CAMNT_0009379103 /DNA_START=36 /DNA_END=666 /DNA_ORIENTATION=-
MAARKATPSAVSTLREMLPLWRFRVWIDDELLRIRLALHRFDAGTDNNVTLAIQSYKLTLRIGLTILASKIHLVLARINCDDAVVAQILNSHLAVRFAGDILDLRSGHDLAFVGIDDGNLSIKQVGEDMRLEGHCCAQGVVSVYYKKSTASLLGRSDTEKVPALASPTLNSSLSPAFNGYMKSLQALYGIGESVSFSLVQKTSSEPEYG